MYINDDGLSDISKALLYDIAHLFQCVDEYITWDCINSAEINEGIIKRFNELENKEVPYWASRRNGGKLE